MQDCAGSEESIAPKDEASDTSPPHSAAALTVPSTAEGGDDSDVVEVALASALTAAAAAGRFDIVGQLARDLEARRLARNEKWRRASERGRPAT